MKVLVVGGTGPIGSHIAKVFANRGNDVTISARNPAQPQSCVGEMPFLQGNYIEQTFSAEDLAPFDTIIFAAGNDVRHMPEGADDNTYWEKANSMAIPEFAQLAKKAGVKNFINVGSFYPHVSPKLAETNAYVRSRKESADGVCALNGDNFKALSIDAPFVVGAGPKVRSLMFDYFSMYALGQMPDIPAFGPNGGTNFISTLSLAEAVVGALENSEGGKAYLVGDENLTFTEYFQMFFDAAGNKAEVVELDQEHPMMPDSALYRGRGDYLKYEPNAEEFKAMGYRRDDVRRAINDVVQDYITLSAES